MILAIDFDGTCVTHEYPEVGRFIGAQRVLKKLSDNGHLLILYTMRSGKELQDAVDWFESFEIPLYGVQTNPTQHEWTTSPKCYAQIYIDDAALGVPLVHPVKDRPFVDWSRVEKLLEDQGLI